VFPSRYEPCGLVLLEALATGVPVVTARSVGGAELISPDVGIVLENCESADDLARALGGLLIDHPRRRAMALRGRELAERLTWRSMADRYVTLLEEAAQRRCSPGIYEDCLVTLRVPVIQKGLQDQ
jgi:glycosyltransferase involved in cell wall biosynthesis